VSRAKDIILAVIAKIGTGGGQGYVLEYRGEAIRDVVHGSAHDVCNMSIEAGARAGLIAPIEVTFDYLQGRDHAPVGPTGTRRRYWSTLRTTTTPSSTLKSTSTRSLTPFVTWGTNPGQGAPLGEQCPRPGTDPRRKRARAARGGARLHGAHRRNPVA
jgi:3-isopropylmalate/(R)-2-methylmalate dehydratase large subunit